MSRNGLSRLKTAPLLIHCPPGLQGPPVLASSRSSLRSLPFRSRPALGRPGKRGPGRIRWCLRASSRPLTPTTGDAPSAVSLRLAKGFSFPNNLVVSALQTLSFLLREEVVLASVQPRSYSRYWRCAVSRLFAACKKRDPTIGRGRGMLRVVTKSAAANQKAAPSRLNR